MQTKYANFLSISFNDAMALYTHPTTIFFLYAKAYNNTAHRKLLYCHQAKHDI